jgi:phosphoadenosine phosphosulfate reductase
MPRSYSSDHDAESGYASGSSSASLPEVYFSRPHLKFINQQLQNLEPQGKHPYHVSIKDQSS